VSVRDLQRPVCSVNLWSGSVRRDRDSRGDQERSHRFANERLEVHGPIVVVCRVEYGTAVGSGSETGVTVPAEMGMNGVRGVMIRLVILWMNVQGKPQEDGGRQYRHQQSRDYLPAHKEQHTRATARGRLKSF
jgi:hypothetical protein